jgi:hypothetical protein
VNRNKQKGDMFERDVVAVFRDCGHVHAERALGLGRHEDRGDVAGVPGLYIECRNRKEIELGAWMTEARSQCGESVPVLVVKRRGKSAYHAYAIVSLVDFAELIR